MKLQILVFLGLIGLSLAQTRRRGPAKRPVASSNRGKPKVCEELALREPSESDRADPAKDGQCFVNSGVKTLREGFSAPCSANPCSKSFNHDVSEVKVTQIVEPDEIGLKCEGNCVILPQHEAAVVMWNYANDYEETLHPTFKVYKLGEDDSEEEISDIENYFSCLKCDQTWVKSPQNQGLMTKRGFAPTDVQGPFKICLPAFDEPDQAQKLATDVVLQLPVTSTVVKSTAHVRCEFFKLNRRAEGEWQWRTIEYNKPDREQIKAFKKAKRRANREKKKQNNQS